MLRERKSIICNAVAHNIWPTGNPFENTDQKVSMCLYYTLHVDYKHTHIVGIYILTRNHLLETCMYNDLSTAIHIAGILTVYDRSCISSCSFLILITCRLAGKALVQYSADCI